MLELKKEIRIEALVWGEMEREIERYTEKKEDTSV